MAHGIVCTHILILRTYKFKFIIMVQAVALHGYVYVQYDYVA